LSGHIGSECQESGCWLLVTGSSPEERNQKTAAETLIPESASGGTPETIDIVLFKELNLTKIYETIFIYYSARF
jgi:hypothetical protein